MNIFLKRIVLERHFKNIGGRELVELIFCIAQITYQDYIKVADIFYKEDYYKELVNILGEKKAQRIDVVYKNLDEYKQDLEQYGVNFISYKDKRFPKFLIEMPNPCYGLFYRGDIDLLKAFSIGIIGSRKPTSYGKYVANKFASELASLGVVIVSGFATGIDTFAHKGATNNNGKTIAVLGTAINNIYPASNKKYLEEIVHYGNLVISEFPPNFSTLPFHFVQRNRLISALSKGLLVVEAGEKSGTLTTVDFALEQGKIIFAVPGNINSLNSLGTNKLLKFGAKFTTETTDILEEFDDFVPGDNTSEIPELSEEENIVYKVLKDKGVLEIEEISVFTNLNIKYIMGILSVLEIKGVIQDVGNNTYTLK